ncbi:radical SAM/SPASM domain-containing protein [Streptosporangium sp. NPDC000239]|uniref:radical SAM/SPASM domain-containing protein n=1 Tax=Streptosporangium sp. NPDC000239 TaxID=3154248 RepID=UPI00332841A0
MELQGSAERPTSVTAVARLQLELTGRCQLACLHCYAMSGPTAGHGTMSETAWLRVLDEATTLGVKAVQLIGGEPTLSPAFEPVLRHAVGAGLKVEVYTNLFHVKERWWELFGLDGVSLATSYYSDRPEEHDGMTARTGSHARTTANIRKARARGIRLRAGMVELPTGEPTEGRNNLTLLGVTDIRSDRLRAIGRTAPGSRNASELCGACGKGKAAISPTGDVWPCVMARWMTAGNVLEQPLRGILQGARWQELVNGIPNPTGKRCDPELCDPVRGDGNDCDPASTPACDPKFCDPDTE